MKKILHVLFALFVSQTILATPFNFYSSIYYTSADESTEPGTVLTNSLTDLSQFNYSTASNDHPIFTTGLYYPVQDCGNQNLWVRVRHIAADPNGIENGHAIGSTMNSPFLPFGSTDRIGGWNGFLYEFQIFQDEVLIGERTNVLGELYPTNITVASLETLYNDGGTWFEWLSFEILNQETSGWYLNSINFTGINPMSTPGFSAELNYATTGTSNSAPTGFSTDFPSGSPIVYAVDMNLSGAHHSEFKMSASGVSVFRYGYEFNAGGYQGMSMEFGVPPVINVETSPSCGPNSGSISLDVTAPEPITYEWSNGEETATIQELSAGDYTVIVTDGSGCTNTATYSIQQFDATSMSITTEEVNGGILLIANMDGSTGNVIYEWSNGHVGSELFVDFSQPSSLYTVTATDMNGCIGTAEFNFVDIEEIESVEVVSIFPNPAHSQVTFTFLDEIHELCITDIAGKVVQSTRIINGFNKVSIDVSAIPKGIYCCYLISKSGYSRIRKLVVE